MTKTNYISASVALLAALLAASFLVLALPKVASSQLVVTEKEIDSNGKLGSIWVNNQLGCQVDHSGNGAGGEFFNGVLTTVEGTDDYVTCGTWIGVLGGATFGVEYGELTPVSQSLTGKGTKRKPFKITTVGDVGDNTGLRVTQVDSYRTSQDQYRTTVTIKNTTNSTISAVLYRGGDCYLNLTDSFTKGKLVDGNQPACVSTDQAKPEELRLIPISSGSKYHVGDYDGLFTNAIDVQQPLANTLNETESDKYLGLSWNVTVGGGNTVNRSNLTKVTIPN